MKFFEEYPEFNGYTSPPPYLLRLPLTDTIPNNRFNRNLLNSALNARRAAPPTLLDYEYDFLEANPEIPDWEPYQSPYISAEEAGIRSAFENAKIESANRELLLLARENYNRLYENVRDINHRALLDHIKVLLLPKVLEKMIEREDDYIKRYHLEFLRDGLTLWLSEKASLEPNSNFLYYPYHMILDYKTGNEAHKLHLQKFFNDKARKVIKKRLVDAGLFSNRKEFFDFTQAHPSDWHSAAHQNTEVNHGRKLSNIKIPQFQALGNYSLGALAKGYTLPAGRNEHYICITNAYSFVNDSFDFNGIQWLGNWDFENGDFTALWPLQDFLYNHTFRNFAKATKHGRDFRTVSPLYEIPIKELQFDGSEMIEGDLCWKVAK